MTESQGYLVAEPYREIDRLRELNRMLEEYACHKWSCAHIGSAAVKCDCGLAELLGKDYVEEIPNKGPIVPKSGM